jgi:plasmid replication initiation protein
VAEKLGLVKSHKDFKHLKDESIRNLLGLQYKWIDESGRRGAYYNVFKMVEWDDDTETVDVEVFESFQHIFENLQREFTVFSLAEFLHIKGKHTKTLYRLLKQWRTVGSTPTFPLEKVRFLFGLDNNYRISNIDQRVINPAVEELKDYFPGLAVHKEYEKRKGKGRPKLIGYSFTFEKESASKEEPISSQEGIASVTGWEKTPRYCPECNRPIYRKMLTNENGSYYLYGHTDFKTGGCAFTTNDYAKLLQEYELADKSAEPITEAQKDNQRKLSDLLKGLFR